VQSQIKFSCRSAIGILSEARDISKLQIAFFPPFLIDYPNYLCIGVAYITGCRYTPRLRSAIGCSLGLPPMPPAKTPRWRTHRSLADKIGPRRRSRSETRKSKQSGVISHKLRLSRLRPEALDEASPSRQSEISCSDTTWPQHGPKKSSNNAA
jgi:hypothetical protein